LPSDWNEYAQQSRHATRERALLDDDARIEVLAAAIEDAKDRRADRVRVVTPGRLDVELVAVSDHVEPAIAVVRQRDRRRRYR